MMFQISTYMGMCMRTCMCVCPGHVYTAVCTCHTHTTHTYIHTQHTHLFRSLCVHFGCMCTAGGITCRHHHSTGPRSRINFFVKTIGGMWSVCDCSWISLCCPTCRTCLGPHTVCAKFIMCATCAIFCY